jgi:hypothetical protein
MLVLRWSGLWYCVVQYVIATSWDEHNSSISRADLGKCGDWQVKTYFSMCLWGKLDAERTNRSKDKGSGGTFHYVYICTTFTLPYYTEDVGIVFFWNVSKYLPDFMTSHPRRQYYLRQLISRLLERRHLSFPFFVCVWGYWHCGQSWPIAPASGDSENDCGEADGCRLAGET